MRKVNLFKLLIIFIILIFLLSGCDEGLLIIKREIGKLPDKTTYVQYVDKELDFAGGIVLYYLKQGTIDEVDMTDPSIRIDEAVNFNVPGEYPVYIDVYNDDVNLGTQYIVTVIPIDEADWLDEEIKREAKRIASIDTSEDQEKIKQVINHYFENKYINYFADTIYRIKKDREYYDADNLIKTYEELIYKASPVFRHFEIQNDRAVVRMTEDTVWLSDGEPYLYTHNRCIFTLKKIKNEWRITNTN